MDRGPQSSTSTKKFWNLNLAAIERPRQRTFPPLILTARTVRLIHQPRLRRCLPQPADPFERITLSHRTTKLPRRARNENGELIRRQTATMHLMYTLNAAGERIYTLKKINNGEVTKSAHPARFSPDDKYSRHRVTLKKRYGLLLTQQST